MKRTIDRVIAVLFFLMALLLAIMTDWRTTWHWMAVAFSGAVIYLIMSREENPMKKSYYDNPMVSTAMTELILLGEDGTRVASWNIYGKNGLVIGRDRGENQVAINLEHATYASMIDIEHAVLNYSGDSWFVEDISDKNGVSVEKKDGKKYKLSNGKPCKLERGDIIHIALTRLQIL